MSVFKTEFFRTLPKIELHSHLNGSVSQATMEKLINYHTKKWPNEKMPEVAKSFIDTGKFSSLNFAFDIFPIIHSVTDNKESIRMLACDVIKEFSDDGVKYLELRSTPREIPGRMTRIEYCESVIEAINETKRLELDIIVTFLLSIDRRRIELFDSTVELYLLLTEKYPDIVVGLDISGDPNVGDLTTIIPKLQAARKQGIKVSVHLAEILNVSETKELLKCNLDRVGHGTYIHPKTGGNEELMDELLLHKTPVEVCLTSNIFTASVPSYSEHQAKYLRDNGIPIIICTDDKGVFMCTLTREYWLAHQFFSWEYDELYDISLASIDHIFANDQVKEKLRNQFKEWRLSNAHYFQ